MNRLLQPVAWRLAVAGLMLVGGTAAWAQTTQPQAPATPPATTPQPPPPAVPQPTPPAQTTPAPANPETAPPPPVRQNRGSAPNISGVPEDKKAAEAAGFAAKPKTP